MGVDELVAITVSAGNVGDPDWLSPHEVAMTVIATAVIHRIVLVVVARMVAPLSPEQVAADQRSDLEALFR